MTPEETTGITPQEIGLKENPSIEIGLRSPEVKARAAELGDLIQAEFGMSIREGISGNVEVATNTHRRLFTEGLKSDDSEQRRLTHLAHLLLEIENNQANRVSSTYGDRIGKAGTPLATVYPEKFYADQMIAEGTELVKGTSDEKLAVTNETLADTFVDFAENYRLRRETLAETSLPEGASAEMTAAVLAAQQTVLGYFGLPDEHSGARNYAKYKEKTKARVEDFRGQQSAACTEYATMSHQLLSFAGQRTRMFSGEPLNIGDENGNYDNPIMEGHVFQILLAGPEEQFIFDPTNPIVKPNPADGSMQLKPYFGKLDSEQRADFYKGHNMEVKLDGTHRLYAAL